jgi:hypothetical protein
MKKTVVIAGPVQSRSGYGDHARDIALALIQSETYEVSVVPTPWGTTPLTALKTDDPKHRLILDRLTSGELRTKPDVFIQITIPNEFQAVGQFNIGITAGIETTLCRPEWLEGCNRMDLVITTSRHSAQVFLENTYEKRDKKTEQVVQVVKLVKPVEVLFEGVDLDVFGHPPTTTPEVSGMLRSIKEDFCFLFVGHWLQGNLGQDRKDIGMLVHTFLDVFKRKAPQNRPALVLKTSMAGFSEVEKDAIVDRIRQIQDKIKSLGWKGELPNIYLLYGDLTEAQMNELYMHPKVKAMVSFTKGEGFGRPLLEFTTTGKPVVASGWSGQLDFLDKNHAVLLPGTLGKVDRSAANDWLLPDADWFTVNYHAAGQILFDVYQNYDKLILNKYLNQSKPQLETALASGMVGGEPPRIKLPALKKVDL